VLYLCSCAGLVIGTCARLPAINKHFLNLNEKESNYHHHQQQQQHHLGFKSSLDKDFSAVRYELLFCLPAESLTISMDYNLFWENCSPSVGQTVSETQRSLTL
jgi:hypothetical protein